jgi:hypothetical protein
MLVKYDDNKEETIDINGTYNLETGIITYEIPKFGESCSDGGDCERSSRTF